MKTSLMRGHSDKPEVFNKVRTIQEKDRFWLLKTWADVAKRLKNKGRCSPPNFRPSRFMIRKNGIWF